MITIGIDSGFRRVDAVALRDGTFESRFTYDIDKIRPKVTWTRGEQLTAMYTATNLWLFEYPGRAADIQVFVEENIVRGSMSVAVGLGQTVGMLLALPFPTHILKIKSWKKYSVGNGNATKQEVQQTLAQKLGPSVTALFDGRQDLFDAAGVALYGDAVLNGHS